MANRNQSHRQFTQLNVPNYSTIEIFVCCKNFKIKINDIWMYPLCVCVQLCIERTHDISDNSAYCVMSSHITQMTLTTLNQFVSAKCVEWRQNNHHNELKQKQQKKNIFQFYCSSYTSYYQIHTIQFRTIKFCCKWKMCWWKANGLGTDLVNRFCLLNKNAINHLHAIGLIIIIDTL